MFDFGVIAPDAADTAQASSSAQSPMSVISQTVDDVEEMGGKYTTLEKNMWVLDGTMELYPGTQTGWQSDPLSEDEVAIQQTRGSIFNSLRIRIHMVSH